MRYGSFNEFLVILEGYYNQGYDIPFDFTRDYKDLELRLYLAKNGIEEHISLYNVVMKEDRKEGIIVFCFYIRKQQRDTGLQPISLAFLS